MGGRKRSTKLKKKIISWKLKRNLFTFIVFIHAIMHRKITKYLILNTKTFNRKCKIYSNEVKWRKGYENFTRTTRGNFKTLVPSLQINTTHKSHKSAAILIMWSVWRAKNHALWLQQGDNLTEPNNVEKLSSYATYMYEAVLKMLQTKWFNGWFATWTLYLNHKKSRLHTFRPPYERCIPTWRRMYCLKAT